MEIRLLSRRSFHSELDAQWLGFYVVLILLENHIAVSATSEIIAISRIADHCSPLEFSVAQWLERPTSVLKVVGSRPICELRIFSEFSLSTHQSIII